MKRLIALLVVAGLGAGGYYYYTRSGADAGATASTSGGGRGGAPGGGQGGNTGGGGGFPGGGPGGFGGPGGPGGFGGRGGRPTQLTVEVGAVKRADMSEKVTVVGNLIGEATVDAVARIAGRLDNVTVRLGDSVRRGQQVAKVEDREIVEQIKQAQASFDVSAATIRQREADLRLAQTNLDRTKSLFDRQLIPKQTWDDTDARYQAAMAQLDLAKAQYAQTSARLDELKLSLLNTQIVSPVSGFVSKRTLDPGAWVTTNTSFMSFVDISTVRLVANIVEKDLRRVAKGMPADVNVDAYPGETFTGRIARVSPVLDTATRTAQIEVEIPNSQVRLKPGMYAKVNLTVEQHPNALVVPTNAIVDLNGRRGVFLPDETEGGPTVAHFQPLELGLSDVNLTEVTSGLNEGVRVITTGAGALREGDKLVIAAQGGGRGGRGGGGRGGGRRGGGPGGNGDPAATGAAPSGGGPAGAGAPESAAPRSGAPRGGPDAGGAPAGGGRRGGGGRGGRRGGPGGAPAGTGGQ